MSNKKDFRNIKVTQFDSSQTLKLSFSELNSAYRNISTNSILRDVYTHFVIERDLSDRVTEVKYYQATTPTYDKITFVSDIAANKNSTYIVLEEPITKKTTAIYISVDGNGIAPNVADNEYVVNITENELASVIVYEFKNIIEQNTPFIVKNLSVVSNTLTLEYNEFGEATSINLGSTGFTVERIQIGESVLVGEVVIDYDIDGNPIYNGSTLNGLVFNPFKAEFETSIELAVDNLTVNVDLDAFAVSPDSVLVVGSEDGTETGIKHALKVDSELKLRVKDEDLGLKVDDTNDKLDTVNVNLTNIETALNNPLQIQSPVLTAGTDDGTISGNEYLFVNNIKQQILAAHDRQRVAIFADPGTKNQRLTQLDYTSATIGAYTARKTITYTLVGNEYVFTSDEWEII